jgi:hypothetical protein
LQRKSLVAVNKISCCCKQSLFLLQRIVWVLQRILLLLKRNLKNFLLSRSFSDPPPSPAKRCKTVCLNHASVKFKIISSYSDFEGPLYTHFDSIEVWVHCSKKMVCRIPELWTREAWSCKMLQPKEEDTQTHRNHKKKTIRKEKIILLPLPK